MDLLWRPHERGRVKRAPRTRPPPQCPVSVHGTRTLFCGPSLTLCVHVHFGVTLLFSPLCSAGQGAPRRGRHCPRTTQPPLLCENRLRVPSTPSTPSTPSAPCTIALEEYLAPQLFIVHVFVSFCVCYLSSLAPAGCGATGHSGRHPSMSLACNAYTQLNAPPAMHSRISPDRNEAMMPPMIITHANGFHKELWEPVLARLDPWWAPSEMYAIDCRNQGDSAILNKDVLGDTFEWITYAKDVLSTVDALGLKKPLGMGHSFGANAIIMAEILNPGTFSAIIAIDPTMFPSQVNLRGPHGGHPLAQLALKRRDHWKTREEARKKLTEKKLFASWHPEVMDLYLKYGLVDTTFKDGSSGVTLKTPKFQEAATFAAEDSAAYDAFDRLNEINIPVHIIVGENSEVNPPDLVDLKVARCKHGSVDILKDAGHLFPMDSPAVTAKCISGFLERFACSQQDLTKAHRRGSKL